MSASLTAAPDETVRLELSAPDRAYLIRVPLRRDEAALTRAIAAAGGRKVDILQLLAILRDEVGRLLAEDAGAVATLTAIVDEQRNAYLDLLRRWRSGDLDEAALDAELGQLIEPPALASLREEMARVSPRYATAVADGLVHGEIVGLAAANLLLVGWEGPAGPFVRSARGVSEVCLREISTPHLVEIGRRVLELMRPPKEQLGNSALPPGGPNGPSSSPAASEPQKTTPSTTTTGTST